MRLTVELSAEEEASLAAKAEAEGVSLDALVHSVLKEVATGKPMDRLRESAAIARLTVWPGRVIALLRRDDIYEDAR